MRLGCGTVTPGEVQTWLSLLSLVVAGGIGYGAQQQRIRSLESRVGQLEKTVQDGEKELLSKIDKVNDVLTEVKQLLARLEERIGK